MKTYARILTAMAMILLLAGHASANIPPEGRQALCRAQMSMDEKKYSEAAATIKKYIKNTAETIHEQVYIALGGAYYLNGDKKSALIIFKKGYAAYPDNKFLCLNTGVTLYELEQFADAGTFLEKAFALQKQKKPDLLFQAGSAYYLGKRYDAAVKTLTRLLNLEKAPKKEWVRLAIHSMLEDKQLQKAETLLLNYLATNPNEAAYWELLAKLHLDRESYAKAASALEICYRLTPPDKQKLEQLASLYRYLNAPLMAASTLQRAYDASPTPDEALKVAALTASAGRTKAAVTYLEKYSSNPSGLLEKGKILYQARKFRKAEATLARCLDETSLPEARFYLALCAWERKDWKTAQTHLSKLSGNKEYKQRAASSLAVLEDLDAVRLESME